MHWNCPRVVERVSVARHAGQAWLPFADAAFLSRLPVGDVSFGLVVRPSIYNAFFPYLNAAVVSVFYFCVRITIYLQTSVALPIFFRISLIYSALRMCWLAGDPDLLLRPLKQKG